MQQPPRIYCSSQLFMSTTAGKSILRVHFGRRPLHDVAKTPNPRSWRHRCHVRAEEIRSFLLQILIRLWRHLQADRLGSSRATLRCPYSDVSCRLKTRPACLALSYGATRLEEMGITDDTGLVVYNFELGQSA